MTSILRIPGLLKNLGSSYRTTLPSKNYSQQDSFVSIPRYARSMASHLNLPPPNRQRRYPCNLQIQTLQVEPYIGPELLTYKEPLVIFDLETNGLQGSIIEFGAIKLYPNGQTQVCTQRIRPLQPIHPRAKDFHNITDADFQDKPHFAQIAPSLWNFLKPGILVGYNIKRFDIPRLRDEFSNAGMLSFAEHAIIIDVYQLFNRQLAKSLPPTSRKLNDASMFYCNEPVINAHTAAGDTCATLKIFYQQLLKMKHSTPLTAQELHNLLKQPHNANNNQLKFAEDLKHPPANPLSTTTKQSQSPHKRSPAQHFRRSTKHIARCHSIPITQSKKPPYHP